jgi:hypothetical protein
LTFITNDIERAQSSAIKEQQSLLKLYPVPDNGNKLVLDSHWTENDGDYPNGYLSQPNRMMFTPDQRIYVSDSREHAVFVFGEPGKIIFKFGKAGSGPEDFVSPLYIGEVSQGRIAVFDSTKLRVQIVDNLGHHINSFRVFKPCSSMSTDHKGHLYFSFFDQNDDYPLIDIFDEVGRKIGHIGTRLKGNSPFFNSVDICEGDDGIFVAWKTFPLVRKYSLAGNLLFEYYLDYGPLREHGELNKSSHFERGGIGFRNVIWKIRAEKELFYLRKPLQNAPWLATGRNACLAEGVIRGTGKSPLSA